MVTDIAENSALRKGQLREYAFSATLAASITVKARNAAEARATLADHIGGEVRQADSWPTGEPVHYTVSMEGEPDLDAVDGEDTP